MLEKTLESPLACETACPHGAITVGEPITNLPEVDPEKCVGCGLCVAGCPGLAVFLLDLTNEGYDTVTIPYEYYPLPEKGQEVYCLARDGSFQTMGTVLRTVLTKANDRTAVVEISVPKGYGMKVRNVSVDGQRMAAETEPAAPPQEYLTNADEESMFVCRCEEITKAEVVEAIRQGAVSANEIKRVLRPGMGLCQGRNCAKTIERIVASELGIPASRVVRSTKRGPVRPVNIHGFTTLDVEVPDDFYNYDVEH